MTKPTLLAALLAAAFLPAAAVAQENPPAGTTALQLPLAYSTCTLTDNTAKVCKPKGPGQLVGFKNLASTAQTATISCYDVVVTISGTAIVVEAALGGSQMDTWPPPGKLYLLGLVCQASGSLTSPGVDVYFR